MRQRQAGAHWISPKNSQKRTGERQLSRGGKSNLNIKFIENAQTRLLAYRSGEIDGVFLVPLSEIGQWAQIPHSRLITAPGMVVWFLAFNVTKPPFDDIHVRQAFAHACDRQGIVRALLHGHGQAAKSIIPPEQWNGLLAPDKVKQLYSQLPDYPFDLEKAKQELAQSSVPGGFSTSIKAFDSPLYYQQALLNLSQNLKQIGVNLDVQSVTSDSWLSHLYAHDLPLQLDGAGPDYLDPVDYMIFLLPSSAAAPNLGNAAVYRSSTVDGLLKDQQSAGSAQRIQDLSQIMMHISQDLPYFAMWEEDTAMVINDKYVYSGYNAIFYDQMWAGNVRSAT